MSEHETSEQQESVDGKPRLWWLAFRGKPVSLQLREGALYAGVTADNRLYMASPNQLGMSPILQGELEDAVREDNGDVVLLLRAPAPGPAAGTVTIVLHAVDVFAATFPERQLVQPV